MPHTFPRDNGLLRRFRRDRRGVAAIEFAFIAPVMIVLYFGVAELCTVMMADRRTSHSNSAIADLAAQTDKLKDADIADIFAVATTVLSPFDAAPLQLRLTSVTLNGSSTPKVEWSAVKASGQADLPQQLCDAAVVGFPSDAPVAAGGNVIMAEAVYRYTSPVAFWIKKDFKFAPRLVLPPRTAAKVARYVGASTTPVACTIT